MNTDDDTLPLFLKGIKVVAHAVSLSFGPQKQQIYCASNPSKYLKKGSLIAKAIALKDHSAHIGVQLLQKATDCMETEWGDATATTILLTHSLLKHAVEHVHSGMHPIVVKENLEQASHLFLHNLEKRARPCIDKETLVHTADTIMHGAPTSTLIAEALWQAGSVKIKKTYERLYLEASKSVEYNTGYSSPYFITNPKDMTVELDHPTVLIIDKPLYSTKELLPLLEKYANKPLLIIAHDVNYQVLDYLILNKLNANRALCCIALNDKLEELVQITKAAPEPSPYFVGTLNKAVITKDRTTLEPICNRAITSWPIDNTTDKKSLESSIRCIQSAIDGGIIAGGGQALIEAATSLNHPAHNIANDILCKAMRAPSQSIAHNTGQHAIAQNILDPFPVTKRACQHAITTTCLILTSQIINTTSRK